MSEQKIKFVLNEMVALGYIPNNEPFEITLDLIKKYCAIYGNSSILKQGNLLIAEKLAGINLMKHSVKNGATKLRCGIIYLISNPAWPNVYKIGITQQDVHKRLASYQTYDPYRRFKLEYYKFVIDIRSEEKRLLGFFKKDLAKGEWINSDEAKRYFHKHYDNQSVNKKYLDELRST